MVQWCGYMLVVLVCLMFNLEQFPKIGSHTYAVNDHFFITIHNEVTPSPVHYSQLSLNLCKIFVMLRKVQLSIFSPENLSPNLSAILLDRTFVNTLWTLNLQKIRYKMCLHLCKHLCHQMMHQSRL